ncbi:hypothetical protein, partial [Streptomyces calidiresistens]|uniref:hypothetical protein n=1 Tax=Streptomyces calidiresistens TaxID=1485586 RepID=UPI001E5395C7
MAMTPHPPPSPGEREDPDPRADSFSPGDHAVGFRNAGARGAPGGGNGRRLEEAVRALRWADAEAGLRPAEHSRAVAGVVRRVMERIRSGPPYEEGPGPVGEGG